MSSEKQDQILQAGITDARSLLPSKEGATWDRRDLFQLKGVVWHQALGWGTVEDVARYHIGPDNHLLPGGLPSIAYTFAIRRDGEVLLCNDLEAKPWSQGTKERPGDENAEFISVMFEGLFAGRGVSGKNIGEPSTDQIISGLQLWKVLLNVFGFGPSDLYGHYHFGKPACPGYTLQRIIDAVRRTPEPDNGEHSMLRWYQEGLKRLGYYTGEIDGIWGPLSKRALYRYQSEKGISPLGEFTTKTQSSLAHELSKIRENDNG